MSKATDDSPQPLAIAVLTVSDTRTEEDDTSGHFLVEALQDAGHGLADKAIVIDDIYKLRAVLSAWIADEQVDAVLITGGTGFSGRDSTPGWWGSVITSPASSRRSSLVIRPIRSRMS